jgi:hypothetical protein
MAESFHGEDGNPIDAKAEAAALIFGLGHPGIAAWLAFSATRTVGYAVAALGLDEFGTREAELDELYAIRENRAALASAILDQVCLEAYRLGARRMFVAITPSDVGRRYYFARHGFSPDRTGRVMRLLP